MLAGDASALHLTSSIGSPTATVDCIHKVFFLVVCAPLPARAVRAESWWALVNWEYAESEYARVMEKYEGRSVNFSSAWVRLRTPELLSRGRLRRGNLNLFPSCSDPTLPTRRINLATIAVQGNERPFRVAATKVLTTWSRGSSDACRLVSRSDPLMVFAELRSFLPFASRLCVCVWGVWLLS